MLTTVYPTMPWPGHVCGLAGLATGRPGLIVPEETGAMRRRVAALLVALLFAMARADRIPMNNPDRALVALGSWSSPGALLLALGHGAWDDVYARLIEGPLP